MNVQPIRLPWHGKDVPHAVIEVNSQCNLTCDGCYKAKTNLSKPLEQIVAEIEFVMAQRNLATLSIAGGEPCLHPQLPEVVAEITKRGLRSLLLTNGTLLTPALLARLKQAGLSRISLHIDSGQGVRPDAPQARTEADLNPLRREIVQRCQEAGIEVLLTLTLYRQTLEQLGDIIEYGHRDHNVCGILATEYTHHINVSGTLNDGEVVTNQDVMAQLRAIHGAEPAYYVASNYDADSYRWLIYCALVTVCPEDGRVEWFYFTPQARVALAGSLRLLRLLTGKHHFDAPMAVPMQVAYALLYGAATLKPRLLGEAVRFLAKARKNRHLKYFTMAYQQAPNRCGEGFEHCDSCPDATVRNFKLIPICIVDKMDNSQHPTS